jgi:hypothetical protein
MRGSQNARPLVPSTSAGRRRRDARCRGGGPATNRPPRPAVDHLPQRFTRALVLLHAREVRLTLIDTYELDDEARRTADVLKRLADLAATSAARVLVTDGLRPALATHLADDLDLRHEPVPLRWERRGTQA